MGELHDPPPSASQGQNLPYLSSSTDGVTRLYVHGKPFLMLAGELHNSSLSSAKYIEDVWPAMRAQSVNTLLGAVTWENIESEEGRVHFEEVDIVLDGARRNDMHLVLLWFGSYKNGMSSYLPPWVKKDVKRFPRMQILEAGGVNGPSRCSRHLAKPRARRILAHSRR